MSKLFNKKPIRCALREEIKCIEKEIGLWERWMEEKETQLLKLRDRKAKLETCIEMSKRG